MRDVCVGRGESWVGRKIHLVQIPQPYLHREVVCILKRSVASAGQSGGTRRQENEKAEAKRNAVKIDETKRSKTKRTSTKLQRNRTIRGISRIFGDLRKPGAEATWAGRQVARWAERKSPAPRAWQTEKRPVHHARRFLWLAKNSRITGLQRVGYKGACPLFKLGPSRPLIAASQAPSFEESYCS